MDHSFEVGEEYRNRKGRYQVLEIGDSKMRVRYENDQEVNLTLAIQAQIWEGIILDEEMEAAKPKWKKAKPQRGPTKKDKQEKLVAQILETDEAVFEILTRLVIPPGQINTYRFFLKNPDDFFSRQQIADATRGSDPQSLRGVFMAFGRRIGSSPDLRVSSLNPRNALFFQHKQSGGKSLLRIRSRVIEIFESYPEFYDFLMNDNSSWLPEEFGSPHWSNSPTVHRLQMQYLGLWDRYILK